MHWLNFLLLRLEIKTRTTSLWICWLWLTMSKLASYGYLIDNWGQACRLRTPAGWTLRDHPEGARYFYHQEKVRSALLYDFPTLIRNDLIENLYGCRYLWWAYSLQSNWRYRFYWRVHQPVWRPGPQKSASGYRSSLRAHIERWYSDRLLLRGPRSS